ncbi:MAG: hypothetical protein KF708_17845 [Pirellulales bacterium]|nr:hypothetical protein [Pirellulales bacterium]
MAETTVSGQLISDDTLLVAVTAIPDERKGERIVVLHKLIDVAPSEICRRPAEAGLPPLWVPGRNSFVELDELPLLGTGKIDLRRKSKQLPARD